MSLCVVLGRLPCTAVRSLTTTASHFALQIKTTKEGNTTTVEAVKAPERDNRKVLERSPDTCSLCTCNIPVKVSYEDVLILEQFMREDGTVLPKELTGLCKKQQLRIERCVMQAHWAGLFPDRTIADFDRAGYKRFRRHWKDDMAMYWLRQKTEPGSWYYIKRYRTAHSQNAKY